MGVISHLLADYLLWNMSMGRLWDDRHWYYNTQRYCTKVQISLWNIMILVIVVADGMGWKYLAAIKDYRVLGLVGYIIIWSQVLLSYLVTHSKQSFPEYTVKPIDQLLPYQWTPWGTYSNWPADCLALIEASVADRLPGILNMENVVRKESFKPSSDRMVYCCPWMKTNNFDYKYNEKVIIFLYYIRY